MLSRRPWRDWVITNAHCGEPAGNNMAVGSVVVSNEIVGWLVPRESLDRTNERSRMVFTRGRTNSSPASMLYEHDVLPVPHRQRPRMRECKRAANLEYAASFRGSSAGSGIERYYVGGGHMTDAGNRLTAELIANRLQSGVSLKPADDPAAREETGG
jgi:hypothetical protein